MNSARIRHMWSRLPNERPAPNDPDQDYLGQVPISQPERPSCPTPPRVDPNPITLPGESDDRVWDPHNPPLYG